MALWRGPGDLWEATQEIHAERCGGAERCQQLNPSSAESPETLRMVFAEAAPFRSVDRGRGVVRIGRAHGFE